MVQNLKLVAGGRPKKQENEAQQEPTAGKRHNRRHFPLMGNQRDLAEIGVERDLDLGRWEYIGLVRIRNPRGLRAVMPHGQAEHNWPSKRSGGCRSLRCKGIDVAWCVHQASC